MSAAAAIASVPVLVIVTVPPTDAGSCFHFGVTETFLRIVSSPIEGEVWLFQVTGMFASGEGPMGRSTNCVPRQPAESCF